MPKPRAHNRRPAQVVSRNNRDIIHYGKPRNYEAPKLLNNACPGCDRPLMRELRSGQLVCFNCTARFTVEQIVESGRYRRAVEDAAHRAKREAAWEEEGERLRLAAERDREADTYDGVVYYVRFRDSVKIGTTTNPARRLSALPWEELMAIEPGNRTVERLRHHQFDKQRLNRNSEWFVLDDEIIAFTEQLVIDNVLWIRRAHPKLDTLPCPRGFARFGTGEYPEAC